MINSTHAQEFHHERKLKCGNIVMPPMMIGKKMPLIHLFADISYLFGPNDSVEFQTYALSEGLILLHVHIFKLPCNIYFLMCHTFASFQQSVELLHFMICFFFLNSVALSKANLNAAQSFPLRSAQKKKIWRRKF